VDEIWMFVIRLIRSLTISKYLTRSWWLRINEVQLYIKASWLAGYRYTNNSLLPSLKATLPVVPGLFSLSGSLPVWSPAPSRSGSWLSTISPRQETCIEIKCHLYPQLTSILFTVNSAYNELLWTMKICSLYPEFLINV